VYLLFYDLIKTNNKQENSTNNQPDTNRVQRSELPTEKSVLGIEILKILVAEQPDHKKHHPGNDETHRRIYAGCSLPPSLIC